MQYVTFYGPFAIIMGGLNDSPFIFNLNCEVVRKFLTVALRILQILTVDDVKGFSLICKSTSREYTIF